MLFLAAMLNVFSDQE